MTELDDAFLEYYLEWFLSNQEGCLAHFATADQGPIPERLYPTLAGQSYGCF
ncbi:hypothetical protein ACSG4H_002540 [Cronobacter turicensis]